jgi:hypothetical protein
MTSGTDVHRGQQASRATRRLAACGVRARIVCWASFQNVSIDQGGYMMSWRRGTEGMFRNGRALPLVVVVVVMLLGYAGGCSSSAEPCSGGTSCGDTCCDVGSACCDGLGNGGVCPNGYSCCPGGCCPGSGGGGGGGGGSTGGGGGGSCSTDQYAAACPDGTTQCCSIHMICCHDSANNGAIGCEFQGFCE